MAEDDVQRATDVVGIYFGSENVAKVQLNLLLFHAAGSRSQYGGGDVDRGELLTRRNEDEIDSELYLVRSCVDDVDKT